MKIVLTGSSSGIGRGLAEHLLASGHQVWGLARSDQTELESRHAGRFRSARCDVGQWPEVERAFAAISAAWTTADALIACAGLQGEIGRALDSHPARWSDTVRANLDGTFYAIRAAAPLLLPPARRAKIICFSGGGATKPRPNFSAYGVAKTGVVRLVETIAEEERERPLDINAIAPGAINTRLTAEVLRLGPDVVGAAEFAAAQKQQATGGASLAKVFGLIDWLLSAESDGITGRLIAAPWDPWATLSQHRAELQASDIYTLRRILPEERGSTW